MIDLWITYGVLAVDNNLDQLIRSADPGFQPIPFTIVWDDGLTLHSVAGGKFIEDGVVAMRDKLQVFFDKSYPALVLTVSLYTAARMCKAAVVPRPGGPQFLANMAIRRHHLEGMIQKPLQGANKKDKGFLAVLGLSILDANVRVSIDTGNLASLEAALHQPIQGAELALLQDFVNNSLRTGIAVTNDPMNDPIWSCGCPEAFEFYDKYERILI